VALETTRVSIVTVVHNAAATLERTMASVLAQSYPQVEYILIDGGSTDGSVDIIRRYERRIAHWVSEPDRGIAHAFNKGIAASSGDVIGILGADDWYEPDAVRTAVRVFEAYPDAGVVCGHARYHAADGADYVATVDPERLDREMTVNHAASFVRKALYRQLGVYDEDYRLAMDYELLLRFKLAGVRFASVDQVLCNVRRCGASDRKWLQAIAEVRRAKEKNSQCDARSYQWWMVARSWVARALSRLGLAFVVASFRRNLSIIKKH
jgi:glycosyltransferase involved in cell wall biosynthesis